MTERQKHILLADKSDFGWSLIREYKRNDLAGDSDDEKKIIRAEARARTQAKQGGRLKSRPANRRDPTALTTVAAAASSQCSGKPIPIVQTRTSQAKPGSCFACNKPGHWRAQCPYTAKSTTRQRLAAGDPENFQGVVNSIVSNSSSDCSDDDLLNSDRPDQAVKIRSLLNYEFTSGQYNSPSVRGRLSLCYDQWVKLGASGFILSVVRNGYKIPFVTLPPPKVSPNNHSAVTHSHFVSEAISDLLRTKCVEILDHKPDIVNPLSVSIQPSGKKRLILDLRHVDLYVFKRKFIVLSNTHK